ncbi:hypothetical protein J3L16_01915 [Alteromonas sp. 5E99-2]|uniref:hypothetical protein n=1 Tax=Alteromonas sp. 5E99-2 TaxID=2817683 RepID=UPI001A996085|nr:hypothetical protein [Alteromonas sp. 5E99-2]MBO1254437.1 hypothetical protein [Alteromonas sp. 5E99-2]
MNYSQTKFSVLVVPIFIFIAIVIVQAFSLYQTKTINFPSKLKEISGIEVDKKGHLWAINDGGDGPYLYRVNELGNIEKKIKINNAKNWDWEDLTQDTFGHFFVGDFGNNGKDRKWMTIYKIENPIDIKSNETSAEIIKFTYPEIVTKEQANVFKDAHYDIEAFIYFKRNLYLFTKNRTNPFDGITRLYKIGDHAANFQAEYMGEYKTCTELKELCWITSAALSPDKSKLVLLDSQRIWLFENWDNDNFFSGDAYQINLGLVTQKEAITFLDDNHVIFTDELYHGVGGNGYVVDLRNVNKIPLKTNSKS